LLTRREIISFVIQEKRPIDFLPYSEKLEWIYNQGVFLVFMVLLVASKNNNLSPTTIPFINSPVFFNKF